MPAESRDAANRVVGGDSIIGESVAADATVWEDAMVDPNGALWDDDSRSPIIALDLELESDPIGSGAQPTNPANNATSASNLPKREPCDMASSAFRKRSWFLWPSSWPRSPPGPRSSQEPGYPSSAARDHHGLTGTGVVDVLWLANTLASPATVASPNSPGSPGAAGGGGPSLVSTGNSAALIPKRFNAAASPLSAACF